MAIAFRANQNDAFTDNIITQSVAYGSNNLANSLLIAYISVLWNNGTSTSPVAISDTQGNLWRQATLQETNGASVITSTIWYVPKSKAGANTVTSDALGVTTNMGLAVMEFTGSFGTDPWDSGAQVHQNGNSANPRMIAFRPNYKSTVTIGGCSPQNATASVGAGWTDSNDNTHLQTQYNIATTVAYKVPVWVSAGANFWSAVTATFFEGNAMAQPLGARTRTYSIPQLALSRLPMLDKGVLIPSANPIVPPVTVQNDVIFFGSEC